MLWQDLWLPEGHLGGSPAREAHRASRTVKLLAAGSLHRVWRAESESCFSLFVVRFGLTTLTVWGLSRFRVGCWDTWVSICGGRDHLTAYLGVN